MRKTMRVLAIDGGGIRGLIPASVLVEVEHIIKRYEGPDARLIDYFDLFAGTSTGGLIAGLLLLPGAEGDPKMTAVDVREFYRVQASTMFHRSLRQRVLSVGALAGAKYSPEGFNRALDAALGRARGSSRPMLSDLLRPTLITTFDVARNRPYFFKQHWSAQPEGLDFSLRDVALATAAAPTFFETAIVTPSTGAPFACVDGGLFATNPTMCGYAEARNVAGVGAADMAILSLGTGSVRRTYDHTDMRQWGALRWLKPLLEMMSLGAVDVVDFQTRQIFDTLGLDASRAQYLRLQPDLSSEEPSTRRMDNARPDNLRRLVEIGTEIAGRRPDHDTESTLERFVRTQLIGRDEPVPSGANGPAT